MKTTDSIKVVPARYPMRTVGAVIALFALAVIAGSPLPQTPAVFVYSLAEPSTFGAMVAIGTGKTAKYVFLAWLTARYPARFIQYRQALRE